MQPAASGTRGAGHREPADAAAAPAVAAPAAAAARASRAGYINTRFHTPELTSAGPAQPCAGGGREHRAGGRREPGRLGGGAGGGFSQSHAPCPTWGADATLPEAYGGAALDGPPPSSPTPLASISVVSPVSPPVPPTPPASRVLPGSVRNCSWRSRGTPKPANGKRRYPEIGTVDGKVGGKESGGAGLSIKVTWGLGGSARERASERDPQVCRRGSWGSSLQNSCHCSLFHFSLK